MLFVVLLFKTKDANAMNSSTSDRSNTAMILKEMDYNLWKFVPPILYIVGTVGNMLTIAVLRRYVTKLFISTSSENYFLTKAEKRSFEKR